MVPVILTDTSIVHSEGYIHIIAGSSKDEISPHGSVGQNPSTLGPSKRPEELGQFTQKAYPSTANNHDIHTQKKKQN